MLTTDQKSALYWLPFYELCALRDLSNHAVDAYQFGGLESCRKLVGIMQELTGPFDTSQLLVVANQIAIVWVERTPALSKKRLAAYQK